MPQQGYAPPSADQYAVVKATYEQTGIMSVKDKTTAKFAKPRVRAGGVKAELPWQNCGEYGEDRKPNVVGTNSDEVGFATLEKHRRTFRVEHHGTKNLPNGIVIGGVEKWRTPDVFGRKPMEIVGWQSDLAPDEENRLGRWARGIHHVTDQERDEAEKEAAFRAANRLQTQQDPAAALTKALVPAMAEAFARTAQNNQSMPSDDDMLAAGFVKTDGKWTRQLAKAGAAK